MTNPSLSGRGKSLENLQPEVTAATWGQRTKNFLMRDEASPGRPRSGVRVARVIDIGSNSVRLVVYEGLTRAPTPIYNEKVLCGLGRNVVSTGRLEEEAVARALRALGRFQGAVRHDQGRKVHVLATAAARDAQKGGGPDFSGRSRGHSRPGDRAASPAPVRRSSRRSA